MMNFSLKHTKQSEIILMLISFVSVYIAFAIL